MKTDKPDLEAPEMERIRNYLRGAMSHGEMNRFEREMEQDPFLSDAVEGYRNFPQLLSPAPSGSSSPRSAWRNIGMYFGAAVVVSAGIWLWRSTNTMNVPETAPETELKTSANTNVATDNSRVEDVVFSDSAIALTFSANPGSEKTLPVEKFISEATAAQREHMQQIQTRGATLDSGLQRQSRPVTASGESDRIYHVLNYKVYDYRGQRGEHPDNESRSSGTPASGQSGSTGSTEIKRPYTQLLQRAIVHFANEQFTEAHLAFELILTDYPDDVNALFYEGMCHFRNGRYSEAIPRLKEALRHPVDLFREESRFYLAKSMVLSGEDAGLAILRDIAASDTYYSAQAADFLEARGLK